MSLLLNLPNELLRAIVALTIPEDIEATCLSCRTLYQAASEFLPEHLRLRRRYRHFSYAELDHEADFQPGDDESAPISTALGFLLRAAANPLVPRYVEHADLRHSELLNWDAAPAGRRLGRDTAARAALLCFLEPNPYLAGAGFDTQLMLEQHLQAMEPGMDHMGRLALTPYALDLAVLTLLTNARALAPPRSWDCFEDPPKEDEEERRDGPDLGLWRVMDLLVKRAREDPGGRDVALGRLETVLPTRGPGYDSRVGLYWQEPLLALPTLREFYGGGLVALEDGYTGMEFERRYEGSGAALETLWLGGCCVGATEMGRLVRDCKELRHLRGSQECKWHGCGSNWDAGHFLAAVVEATGKTLETLSLAVTFPGQGTGTGMVSLKGFEVLRSVELALDYLEGPPVGGEDDLAYIEEGGDELVMGDSETPPLCDVLPATVESCLLWCTAAEHLPVLEMLFRDFDEAAWAEKLPRLKSLKVIVSRMLVLPPNQGRRKKEKADMDPEDARWDVAKRALKVYGGELSVMEEHVSTYQDYTLPRRVALDVDDWYEE
ncbi:MAG: hypothetical protein INR71_01235 [Terriglobus roseus]|nr:hypothetical protein [Terriglobus roseus]